MEEENNGNNVGSQVKSMLKAVILKYVAIGVAIILAIAAVLSLIIGIIASIFSDYDEDGSGGYIYIGGIVGGDVQTKVWFTLKNYGLSDYAVAGVMGNLANEGGWNPASVEYGYDDVYGGIGLCGWTDYPRGSGQGRNTNLKNYANSKGIEWTDTDTQIEFLLAEITGEGPAKDYATQILTSSTQKKSLITGQVFTTDSWKNATSAEEAAVAFCWLFEIPAAKFAHEDRRIASANEYYDLYSGQVYASAGGTQIDTTNSTSLYWGKYRSNSGRVYTLYKQNDAPGVPEGHCYYTSIAIIKSGFGDTRNQIAYNSSVGNPLTAITSSEVQTYLKSGGAVMIYADFYGSGTSTGHGTPETFYCGSGRKHAIALLDIDENNNVFVANPYYIGNGSEGQKGGGWYPLSKMLSYKNLAGTANAASYYGIK